MLQDALWLYTFSTSAGVRLSSNGAASSSTFSNGANSNGTGAAASIRGSTNGKNGSSSSNFASQLPTPQTDARFEEPVGRTDPRVAQVALDPESTPIIDLNAATFQTGGSPNRVSLADLLHNDGAARSPHPLLCSSLVAQVHLMT